MQVKFKGSLRELKEALKDPKQYQKFGIKKS